MSAGYHGGMKRRRTVLTPPSPPAPNPGSGGESARVAAITSPTFRSRDLERGEPAALPPSPAIGRGEAGRGEGGALRAWLRAVRVPSFTASVVPILVASALALYARTFDPLLGLVMLLAAVACHAGSNLANDYHDHRTGVDTVASLGPGRVIPRGVLEPAQVRRGMIVAFALATALGLIVVASAGWPILALALASLAAAYFYTGGPKPLGYVALGEVTVFLFMGPVMVCGAYYVYAGTISAAAALASLAIGCLVAAILHANNVRDVVPDRAAGKVTLANLFGRRGATIEFVLLLAGAYLAALALPLVNRGLLPALVVLVTIPRAVLLARALAHATSGRALNAVLRRTAGLHLAFGALLTIGVLVSATVARLR